MVPTALIIVDIRIKQTLRAVRDAQVELLQLLVSAQIKRIKKAPFKRVSFFDTIDLLHDKNLLRNVVILSENARE